MPLNKVNVAEALANVKQPFMMVEVARVGSLVMHTYVCQGTVQWHKHIDHDELFLIQTGWMALESEWGNIVLKPDEMVIVPKGIGHRSSSQMRAVVLLVQPRAAADSKNGHRRIFALPRQDALQKHRLMDVAARADLFCPEAVADMEDLAAQVVMGNGLSPEYVNVLSSSLWLVLQGNAQMEAEGELIEMGAGELVVIGQGVPHRWTAFADTTLFLLSRWVEQA